MNHPDAGPSHPRRLHINGRFLLQDVTGVQRVAIEFVRALDELVAEGALPGLAVTVWVPRRGDLVTPPDYRALEVRRAGRLTSHAWEQLELPTLVGTGPLLCLGNLAPVAMLAGRRPVHTMVHDLSYAYFPHAYSRLFRLLYRVVIPCVLARSRRVFTVSESERLSILSRYGRLIGPRRLVAVQNGGGEGAALARPHDEPSSRQSGGLLVPSRAARDRVVLYVGSLTRRKNAEGLARAATELVRTTDLDFVFVGSTGTTFEATGWSVPNDVADRLTFLGQVNDAARIEEEYRRASVFLFPSFYEASPLPPVEAMRFGCPVVAADIPSLRERCGSAVAYCDPGDVDTMVTQVRILANKPELWEDLQAAGLRRAATYSWRQQVRTVLRHIDAAS